MTSSRLLETVPLATECRKTQESGVWFAQGLEIDYAAQGSSFEDVRKNFENGLMLTIGSYLKTYGDLQRLLVVAPDEVWKEATGTNVSRYLQSSSHLLAAEWPYDGYDFYITKAA